MTIEEMNAKYGAPTAKVQVKKPVVDTSSLESRWGINKQGKPTTVIGSLKESFNTAKAQVQGTGEFKDQIAPQRGVELAATITGAPIKAAVAAVPERVKEGISNAPLSPIPGSPTIGDVASGVGKGFEWLTDKISDIPALQRWTQEHPEAATALENVAKTSGALSETAGNLVVARTVVDAVPKIVNQAKTLVNKTPTVDIGGQKLTLDKMHSAEGTKMFEKLSPEEQVKWSQFDKQQSLLTQIKDATKAGKDVTDLKQAYTAEFGSLPSEIKASSIVKIQEKISPKITSKETQKIIEEGRLTRGKEGPIFGKRPDLITQSEEVTRASETIAQKIPNAAKMTDAELSIAIDNEITSTAKALQGEMKTVQIRPDTTGKVIDRWKQLKQEQSQTPDFLDNQAGNTAFQTQFENRLKSLEWDITDAGGKFKKPSTKTLDDIWNARKDYDASIPDNVKTATTNSSPVLQNRKEMWLQNRAILSDAINDTVSGLGATSRTAFSEMTDMYMARQNILSKAKIDTTGTMGLIPTNKKELLKWGITVGGSLLGGKLLFD